jgi:hypothetical protein
MKSSYTRDIDSLPHLQQQDSSSREAAARQQQQNTLKCTQHKCVEKSTTGQPYKRNTCPRHKHGCSTTRKKAHSLVVDVKLLEGLPSTDGAPVTLQQRAQALQPLGHSASKAPLTTHGRHEQVVHRR